jgi:hypothetical protein
MKIKALSILAIASMATAVLAASVLVTIPRFTQHENVNVGVVTVYHANSGTNSVLNIQYPDDGVPFRLHDVVATTNGVEVAVTVNRVWVYARDLQIAEVSTNFFGAVVTNYYPSGQVVEQITTEIYDSTADTLPMPEYVLPNDAVQVDFGSNTGVTVRIVGTAQ